MTSVATAYSVTAAGVSALPAQSITIPTTGIGRDQGPTGEVFNDTSSFLVNGTPATYIFAGLNGLISAWNSSTGTTAQIEASTGAATPGWTSRALPRATSSMRPPPSRAGSTFSTARSSR